MNRLEKILTGTLDFAAGYLLVTAGAYIPFVISDARKSYRDDCDYLLILGGDIIGADEPSPQLFERMKAAVDYLNEHPHVLAVPCGGCFRPGQKKSEAVIIADYLIARGISPERIILEDNSTTTVENFKFGLPIIEAHSGKKRNELKIAFLSSTYHMHRAGVIASQLGIKNVLRVSCPTPGAAMKRFVREYFVGYQLIFLVLGKQK